MPNAPRSFANRCPTHEWPLIDGVCPICAGATEQGRTVALCPPHATWERNYKVWVFDQSLLVASQIGTDDERRQKSWELKEHTVAYSLGLLRKWVTPAAETHERLVACHQRLASASKDEPCSQTNR